MKITLKNQLVILTIFSSFFLTITVRAKMESTKTISSITTPPPSFPSATEAFKKLYSGELSIADAQKHPWFISYTTLYTTLALKRPKAPLLTQKKLRHLLTDLSKQKITVEAASTRFSNAQSALKTAADETFTTL